MITQTDRRCDLWRKQQHKYCDGNEGYSIYMRADAE